jgi:polar amino acid transport system permease protein
MTAETELKRSQSQIVPWTNKLSELPYWALAILLIAVLIIYFIIANPIYNDAFLFLLEGVKRTVTVTVVSFAIALVLGLIAGLGRVSKNVFYYNISTFYVELVRGVPMLVLIIYFAYVVTPFAVVPVLQGLGSLLLQVGLAWGIPLVTLNIQDIEPVYRAIAGLAFGYGAFEAEVFRAGIESIGRGQMEAARGSGMTYFQAMRYVILPQAVRRILPPLGNDFISMLKDSALISVLAVRDLTHLGKLNRSRTFRTFETWNTVAFLYLSMTLLLSMGVKFIERRMSFDE